jgi:hypothetical protein
MNATMLKFIGTRHTRIKVYKILARSFLTYVVKPGIFAKEKKASSQHPKRSLSS